MNMIVVDTEQCSVRVVSLARESKDVFLRVCPPFMTVSGQLSAVGIVEREGCWKRSMTRERS